MAVIAIESTQVARPLRVLVPLIKEDLEHAREASERASQPYYQAVGEKLIEAKAQLQRGDFASWVQRNFRIGARQAQMYMQLTRTTADIEKRGGIRIHNFREAVQTTTKNVNYGKSAAWQAPVKEAIGRVNVEALKQDALAKQEERALQRKLALSLIDIGFKALASKLHPDKGGSREAMSRLNHVREMLQHAVPA